MDDELKASSDRTSTESRDHVRSYQLGKLFWGLLLMLIGGLFLLHNFNVIDVAFGNVWLLWPLFLIAAGASMLSLRGWLGISVATTLGVFVLIFVLSVALGWLRPDSLGATTIKTVDIKQSSQQVKRASIAISGGAGQIRFKSDDIASLVNARLQSNSTTLTQQSEVRGDTQNVDITIDGGGRWWHGNYRNELIVTLNQSTPLSLKLDAGASSIRGDLSRTNLERLEVDSGASDIDIRVGSKSNTTDIQIDVGMSSVTIAVPKSSGVSLRLDSGMSSTDTSGLSEVSDGYFESENYGSASKQINIRGTMGMSNFDLKYY